MKTALIVSLFLPLLTLAHQKSVFHCQSPSHTFQIKQASNDNQFLGTLYSPSQKPVAMKCTKKDENYNCKKGDYNAKVQRGASTGRMIVQLELEGEFDVESGYVDTIYCR